MTNELLGLALVLLAFFQAELMNSSIEGGGSTVTPSISFFSEAVWGIWIAYLSYRSAQALSHAAVGRGTVIYGTRVCG